MKITLKNELVYICKTLARYSTPGGGAPLCVGECKDVIRHVLEGGQDTILLTRNGSYVFGQLTRDGWRMVLAQPKGAGELLSNAKTPDYQVFLKALKESGWERVPLAGLSAIARQFFGIMGNFLFMVFTGIESLPGSPCASGRTAWA